jgi:hypothetical protein
VGARKPMGFKKISTNWLVTYTWVRWTLFHENQRCQNVWLISNYLETETMVS